MNNFPNAGIDLKSKSNAPYQLIIPRGKIEL